MNLEETAWFGKLLGLFPVMDYFEVALGFVDWIKFWYMVEFAEGEFPFWVLLFIVERSILYLLVEVFLLLLRV